MPRRNARRSNRRSTPRFAKSSFARRLRAEPLEDRRMLATITVTSALDNTFLDSQVTLREAIQAANTDTSVSGSEAGDGVDTIVFDSSLAGQTIEISNVFLELTEGVTIDATALPGGVTIDAAQRFRIFEIRATAGDVTLAGLTLTGGRTTGNNNGLAGAPYSGGAIRSFSPGTLTLDHSTVTGNRTEGGIAQGGGIFTDVGDVVLISSTVSGNSTSGGDAGGGGIFAGDGDVTLIRSTVSGNRTSGAFANGGGILAASGQVTLTRSTVSDNSTAGDRADGGGIFAGGGATLTDSTVSNNRTGGRYADGGGVATGSANITISGSTISGNVASGDVANGGGVFTFSGDITLNSSTVTGNQTEGQDSDGAGVAVGYGRVNPLLTIQHSIVANNRATDPTVFGGPEVSVDRGTDLDVDFSLIGDAHGLTITGSGNLIGDSTGAGVIDPLLGPLSENGGLTQTHNLLAGSPAIDAGNPAFDTIATPQDQRGGIFARLFGERVDIGAVERQGSAGIRLIVTAVGDINDGVNTIGDLTLREAIGLANGNVGPNTIIFGDLFNTPQTIELLGQLPTIREPLTIEGPGQTLLTIDAGDGEDGFFATADGFRHFDIDDGLATRTNVRLSGLTLTGGDVPLLANDPTQDGAGGAIRSVENLNLDDLTITRNAAIVGGGVHSEVGFVEVFRATISDNHAIIGSGGGIYNDGADLIVTNSTISGNLTEGDQAFGGGIYTRQRLELNQSTISGNRTFGFEAHGAGVYAAAGVEIASSTITLNDARGFGSDGGGIHLATEQRATLSNTILSRNFARQGRGGDFGSPTFLGDNRFELFADFSLFGQLTDSVAVGQQNMVTDDPGLKPLANNGGPTQTHEPESDSRAIDRGRPGLVSGFDQRGAPFRRAFDDPNASGARIDIGAVELQPTNPTPGDYNDDLVVNAADYAVWRNSLNATGLTPFTGPDGDGDGVVTDADFDVWLANFGTVFQPPAPEPAAESAVVFVAPVLSESIESPVGPFVEETRDVVAVDNRLLLLSQPALAARDASFDETSSAISGESDGEGDAGADEETLDLAFGAF